MDKEKSLPQEQTTKKIKVVGTETFINAETGELVDMQVTSIEDRDFNFSKVWLSSLLAKLDLIGNQKLRVASWVIEHINKENQLIYSQREIADHCNISIVTVNRTIKTLVDADFLVQKGKIYMINPNIIFKGTRNARLSVLSEYYKEPPKPLSVADKIDNLKASIDKLTKQLTALEKQATDVEVEEQLSFTNNGEIVQRAVEVKPKKKRGKANE